MEAVRNDVLFGFIESDIHNPDNLFDTFKEMPPLFCNSNIKFEDVGEFMQNYIEKENLHKNPRRLLVSGLKAEKIMLSSPYLKWLLDHGLVVTRVYQVVEYAGKTCFKTFVKQVSDA